MARSKAEKLKELEEDVCRRLIKDKAECKGSVEIGNVKIKPKYESVKKETILKSKYVPMKLLLQSLISWSKYSMCRNLGNWLTKYSNWKALSSKR